MTTPFDSVSRLVTEGVLVSRLRLYVWIRTLRTQIRKRLHGTIGSSDFWMNTSMTWTLIYSDEFLFVPV